MYIAPRRFGEIFSLALLPEAQRKTLSPSSPRVMGRHLSKEVDDGLQLVIEAIVSSATDISTAGTGRIVALCASAIYMATRHGRDVVLPRFTEMNISFDRPLSLGVGTTVAESPGSVGGK